jgi:hypothetical protein
MWEGECESLMKALREARFLDGSHIHHWYEYAGRLAERRFANAQRMRRARSGAAPSPQEAGAMSVHARATHVQSDDETGARLHTGHTGHTGQTEPTGPNKHGERAPRAPSVPEQLTKFDAILRDLPGYRPTSAFYEKTLARYSTVDLDAEAIKLADWVTRKRTQCTTVRVFNWLDNALADVSAGGREPKEAKRGTADRTAERPRSELAKYATGPRPDPG